MFESLRPAPPPVREAVQRGLVLAGCPVEVADRLAADVTAERHDGTDLVCLLGHCTDPAEGAAELLVAHAVDENAEAHDRTARGEPGYSPLWPLPNRGPRRK